MCKLANGFVDGTIPHTSVNHAHVIVDGTILSINLDHSKIYGYQTYS